MGQGININTKTDKVAIKGLDKLVKKLRDLDKDADIKIDAVTDGVALEIATDAKQTARNKGVYDNGELVRGIQYTKVEDNHYQIVAKAPHSPYQEFGTGMYVDVPAEMQEVASRIRSNPKGNFKEGLQAIKEWCKRKGIDEGAAYPIFLSIIKKGIKPRPFLYPAFQKGKIEFIKQLEKLLNKMMNE